MKYESYKDSGVDWLGEIPSHWRLQRFKHHFRSAMGETILASDLIEDGEYPVFSATEGNHFFGKINNPRVKLDVGDLVIPARGSIGFPKLVLEKATCSQTTIYAKRTTPINSNFVFYYLIGCKPFLFKFTQTAIPQLTVDEVKNNFLIIPSSEEQFLIVKFLDCKTAQIDKAISRNERLIELLQERRQILIHNAVTRGLNASVETKNSGVDWIGEIPEHWQVVSNFVLFEERNESGNENLPILMVSIHTAVSSEEISDEENIRGKVRIEDKTSYKLVKPNDIVFNMMRAWQGAIGEVKTPGMVSPAYIVAKPKSEFSSHYLEFQFRTQDYVQQIDRYSKGITDFRKRLYWNEFKRLKTVLPPIEEQKEISAFIENLNAKIDNAISCKQKEIEKLKEYKAVLINSAVTGKIKVKN